MSLPRQPLRQPLRQPKPQGGVAVLTALLLVTLLLVTISGVRNQQQVQIRLIENQQLRLQSRWILLGALDYSRLILNEDAKNSVRDDLTEPWATPIAETPVTTYAEKEQQDQETSKATVSGKIIDATSRYNLSNLAFNRVIDKREVNAFKKLLTNLRLNPSLADSIALAIASAQTLAPVAPADPNNPNGGTPPGGTPPGGTPPGGTPPGDPATRLEKPVPLAPNSSPAILTEIDDLLAIQSIDPTIAETLKNYVIFLPRPTANLITINVNTTSAEVLSARIDTLTLSQAKSVILARERASFKDIADFTRRLKELANIDAASPIGIATTTPYFLVTGRSRNERATLETNALVERSSAGTRVVWLREI